MPNPDIARRRVKIAFDPDTAMNWGPTLGAMSFFLPNGEAYFLNVMKSYLDEIEDPVLKDQTERFIFQEGAHAAEHVRANRILKQVQPYGTAIERMSARILNLSRRFMPRPTQLATSSAMEHFTAILADSLLRQQEQIRAVHEPEFAELWLWHAAEEIEHKAVCFDVYQYVAGKGLFSYLHRVVVMAVTSLILIGAVVAGFAMIRGQQKKAKTQGVGDPGRPPKAGALAKELSLSMYLDYYRPGFHPWQQQNLHLVEAWKALYPELQASVA